MLLSNWVGQLIIFIFQMFRNLIIQENRGRGKLVSVHVGAAEPEHSSIASMIDWELETQVLGLRAQSQNSLWAL